jgi:nitroreductase
MRTCPATREFRDEPLPDGVLRQILDTARFAPSGANQQPWTVLVIKDPEMRRKLKELSQLAWREYAAHREAGVRPFAPGPDGRFHGPGVDLATARATPAPNPFVDDLETVPSLLVVVAHLPSLAVMDALEDHQSIAGGASVYPFVQNILLAARDLGYGGAVTTMLTRDAPAVTTLLGIPPGYAVAAAVALGRPARQLTRLRRRPVEEFTHLDTWTGPPLTL